MSTQHYEGTGLVGQNRKALAVVVWIAVLGDFPKIQIVTVEELLQGAQVKMPPTGQTFKQAQREKRADATQSELELDT